MGSMVKTAVGDFLITSMRLTTTPFSKLITTIISNSLNLHTQQLLPLFLISTLTSSLIITLFGYISNFLGGAAFNPATTLAFYAAGFTRTTLLFLSIRFIAQSVGAVAAVKTILYIAPKNLIIKAPSLEVDIHIGAIVEGLSYIGGKFTGPSMNPANAYGWAYVQNWDHKWELYYVYWVGPLIGATLAGKVYAFMFVNSTPSLLKKKKKKKKVKKA
ncbi:hypothetical protein ACFE04_003419 [Oxalis oulophora]